MFTSSSRPRILVVGLELEWAGAARLPRALQEAGFEVGVACRANAFMAHTRFRDRFFSLPEKNYGKQIFQRLQSIVHAWSPQLLLPMDDRTTAFFAHLHEIAVRDERLKNFAQLLARSLGNLSSVREACSKRWTMEAARRLGIRVPETQTVTAPQELAEFGRRHGYPIVVKRSFDFGGNGVVVCKNENEIPRSFRLARWDKSPQARALLWFEYFSGRRMSPRWLPVDESITVSQFIKGRCAMSLAAVFEGQMLAALTAEKERSHPDDCGPSSVVKFVRNAEMRAMSEKLLNHWKLTGLIGFDFMIDAKNQPWLIECNPRPTPIGHLGERAGENLCLALYRQFVPGPPPQTIPLHELIVAHFPQEFWRDPNSPYFKSAFYDVPGDDLGLLNCLKQAQPPRRKN